MRHTLSSGTPSSGTALASLLLGAGALHLARPQLFTGMVPAALPGTRRGWVAASGLAELAVGAGLARARTRRTAGLAAAVLFVAVLPGNVTMALGSRRRSRGVRVITWARLPLQVPLVWWALRVHRTG